MYVPTQILNETMFRLLNGTLYSVPLTWAVTVKLANTEPRAKALRVYQSCITGVRVDGQEDAVGLSGRNPACAPCHVGHIGGVEGVVGAVQPFVDGVVPVDAHAPGVGQA